MTPTQPRTPAHVPSRRRLGALTLARLRPGALAPARRRRRPRAGTLTLAVLPFTLALAACSTSATTPEQIVEEAQERVEEAQGEASASDTEMVPLEDLPDCGLVESAASALIGDFVYSPDDAGVNETPLQVDMGCVWVTPETTAGELEGLAKFGGLSMGIAIEKKLSPKSDWESAGLVREYGPAEDAGAYVISLNPDFTPEDELSAAGVIVNKGNVSITITAVGLYIDASNIVDARTNADAIDAALRVHAAMRE